jgi:hypothetical protein
MDVLLALGTRGTKETGLPTAFRINAELRTNPTLRKRNAQQMWWSALADDFKILVVRTGTDGFAAPLLDSSGPIGDRLN